MTAMTSTIPWQPGPARGGDPDMVLAVVPCAVIVEFRWGSRKPSRFFSVVTFNEDDMEFYLLDGSVLNPNCKGIAYYAPLSSIELPGEIPTGKEAT